MSIRWQIQRRNPFGQKRRQQAHEQLQQRQQRDLKRHRAGQERARAESLKERSPDAYRSGPARKPPARETRTQKGRTR